MRISDWSSDVCSSDLRNAQVRMLDDMILELDAEIADSFPDVAELDDKLEALQAELGQLERELAFARDSAQAGLVQKKRLIEAISGDQQRANDVSVTLESFAQPLGRAAYRERGGQ